MNLVSGFATLAAIALLSCASARAEQRFEFTQVHMGTSFNLVLYAESGEAANRAAERAFDRVAALDHALSDYDPESELRRLCRTAGTGKAVRVSADLFHVLARAVAWSEKSEGAFDVTVGPLVRLWRRARRTAKLPDAQRLADARDKVGYTRLRLDAKRRTVELTTPGMLLDLGGIAKGYAVEAALAVLVAENHPRALVDGGGDVAVGDPPPGKPAWRIGLASLDRPDDPSRQFLLLSNAAVATSGDAYQFVEIDGVRYSHIVDPRTGLGLTQRSSVTVVAPSGTDADALASAVSVLGPKRGLRLVDETPGAAAMVVRWEDGELRQYFSARWGELEIEAVVAE